MVSLLYLNSDPIRFEPVNNVTSVFFDETNEQIFTVRSGGATGVSVKCPDQSKNLSFRMEDKGTIISIKTSTDQKVLGIQRTMKSVEYVNLVSGSGGTTVGEQYTQACRSSTAVLLDFFWVGPDEVVYVSDAAVEHYLVLSARRQLKLVRSCSLQSCWSVYSARFSCLMVAFGLTGNLIQPFTFKSASMNKLAKFEVEVGSGLTGSSRLRLQSSDVTLCDLHGCLHLLVMQHNQSSPVGSTQSRSAAFTRCLLYKMNSDGSVSRAGALMLTSTGRFAISVIDNVIIIHHQQSKVSSVFDVLCRSCCESAGPVSVFHPVCAPASIRPFQLHLLPSSAADSSPGRDRIDCQLYASSWVVFQPCTVIDAQLGCYWRLGLDLESVPLAVTDPLTAGRFLLARRGAKPVLVALVRALMLQYLNTTAAPPAGPSEDGHLAAVKIEQVAGGGQLVGIPVEAGGPLSADELMPDGGADLSRESSPESSLTVIGQLLDLMNAQYQQRLQYELASQMSLPVGGVLGSTPAAPTLRPVTFAISQSDLYMELLHPLHRQTTDSRAPGPVRRLTSLLVEYIRSLDRYGISVDWTLHDMLVRCLCVSGRFYQIQQFLQYHVLDDSKELVCLLLSLQGVYPPAAQMAVDMLHRLGDSQEEILEMLLEQGDITAALRLAGECGLVERLSARRFLELAKCSSSSVFYSTFKLFEQRNVRNRGRVDFLPGEQCEPYVRHIQSLFSVSSCVQTALETSANKHEQTLS